MATKKSRNEGNRVSEWFGQRIYPHVRINVAAVTGGNDGCCPFLSGVLHKATSCVKAANAKGVCTISSTSNGQRQDWLVCPFRVIDSKIVSQACQIIFGLDDSGVDPEPVSILADATDRARIESLARRRGAVYLFFQNKLGGEISVIGTTRSPEISFDVTLVEVKPSEAGFAVTRYGILELQTMDYHGTYKHAVKNLNGGLHLHPQQFPTQLAANLEHWAGEGVEGPNIANVFKRTFYQVLLKFRLTSFGPSAAAGTILAIPQSVWDSWQPFIGAPLLKDEAPGIKRFVLADGIAGDQAEPMNAFICVFDTDASSKAAISPVVIKHYIRVSPQRLAQHAFTGVPEAMLETIAENNVVIESIKSRLGKVWPAFKAVAKKRAGTNRTPEQA